MMGAGESQLLGNRAEALRQELAQAARRAQLEKTTPKTLERADRAAELRPRRQAPGRERGFGLER